MNRAPDAAVQIQCRYYTQESEDSPCLALLSGVLRTLKIQSLLDVGSATVRELQEFAAALPGTLVCSVEPMAALVQQGVVAGVTKSVSSLQASGDALPFADASFDAVSEFSILHHVPNPAAVVAEMLRVARHVVVIANSNRFGQGPWPAKLLKLFLYKVGLWHAFDFMCTRGRRYQVSEGDGLFYSYSVYDSYD